MPTDRFKRFTILHSNDMHGDFLAEIQGEEGQLIGGLSLLSGYINQVRQEEKNVLVSVAVEIGHASSHRRGELGFRRQVTRLEPVPRFKKTMAACVLTSTFPALSR